MVLVVFGYSGCTYIGFFAFAGNGYGELVFPNGMVVDYRTHPPTNVLTHPSARFNRQY